MIETLTADSFRPHLGTLFELSTAAPPAGPASEAEGAGPAAGEPPAALTLVEVRTTGTNAFKAGWAPARLPFSAVFRGPRRPILQQSIYHLAHPQLGAMALFLVPIGSGAAGTDYEACFT